MTTARLPIVAGNWKMFKTAAEAVALVNTLKPLVANLDRMDIVVCPPFTALAAVRPLLDGSNLQLGAQNVHWEKEGAFTGEISAPMLKEHGVRYVIVGHSERRQFFGETDAGVNKRARAALAHGLRPIVCVGETLQERESNKTEQVVRAQVMGTLAGFSKNEMLETVIAYEPVWAIGTGKNATPQQAQEMHAFIRRLLAALFDAD
ncbi:MAG: triose-phosphate isomerase, partial [Verrucomicrobiae bacterium]|nr:triose-phosphate isomerase [Verrucomicrobiae bacterium]